jgi:peptide deformylase|tara:strand:- start:80611 stop:81147 length:537 start_codon:yes stop_codon:yes gene_type:complete
MKPILQTTIPVEDTILRSTSLPVPEELFGTPELAAMLRDMEASLDAMPNGVALAAPQIGLLYRIFIVRYDRMAPPPQEGEPELPVQVGVFINPSIVRTSKRRVLMDEGCLSVDKLFGTTKRFERSTVQARDEHGVSFTRGGGGILSQAFQHEIDHLEGMLFIDHATDTYTPTPPSSHE